MIALLLLLAVIVTAAVRKARKRRSTAQVTHRPSAVVQVLDSTQSALTPRRSDKLAGRP